MRHCWFCLALPGEAEGERNREPSVRVSSSGGDADEICTFLRVPLKKMKSRSFN